MIVFPERISWLYSDMTPAFFPGSCGACCSTVPGVFLFGGRIAGVVTGGTETYYPSSDTWPVISWSWGSARARCCCSGVPGTLWLFTGVDFSNSATRSTHSLDIASAVGTTGTNCPTPARAAASVFHDGTYSYLCGGTEGGLYDDCDRYSPDTWTSMTSMSIAQWDGAGTYADGVGVCVGSQVYIANYTSLYDVGSDAWSVGTDMIGGTADRYNSAACTISDKAYFCGGGITGFFGPYDDTSEYVPSTDTWTAKAAMPSPARDRHGFTAVGGAGYATCGENASGDTDEYTPDTWTSKTSTSAIDLQAFGYASA